MTEFLSRLGEGVLANLVFVVLLAGVAWAGGLRRQQKFLHLMGASFRRNRVEIILSNLYLDHPDSSPEASSDADRAPSTEHTTDSTTNNGTRQTPRGTWDTERGYTGPAVAQQEYDAATAMRDVLTRSRLIGFPVRVSGLLQWISVDVTIRPSQLDKGTEAAWGFVRPRPNESQDAYLRRLDRTGTVIVIGSPIYNRATFDLLGPVVERDSANVDRTMAVAREPDVPLGTKGRLPRNIELVRDAAHFAWVRDHIGVHGTPLREGVRYRKGVRKFELVGRHRKPLEGRTQDGGQQEQSIVQQVRLKLSIPDDTSVPDCPDSPFGPWTRSRKPREVTITLFAGVSDGGTAAAVKEFLHGENGNPGWRRVRKKAQKERGTAKPWFFAYYFSRPVDDPTNDVIDFSPRSPLGEVNSSGISVK